jgi:SPP1 gp7 family putative phage head morphogenesis protein
MNSSEYWAKREAEALKHYITDEKEYDKQLKRIYSNMLDACQTEINAFYGKYAAKEGITLAEAKKRVSELDIKAYERKAAKYVKEKDFSAKANEEMRLYNATMKINRLEMLKANIGKELIAGHDELEKFMEGILQGRTEDELKRQAGILGKTIKNNAQKANAIVNASFHNAKFSDRIWMYQDLMKADLAKLLESGLIQGKNPRVLARELKKTFNTSTFNAERLMRTELARVQTEAQKQSFIRNGFEEYEFIVNAGCCPICQALNGKHFKVEKMMPGENAPPIHPHCRCSTAAYSDRKEYEEWLDFLDKGGTTEEYNKIKAQKVNSSSTSKAKQSDIIQSGGKNIVDYSSWSETRTTAATAQYEKIRIADDIKAVAKSSGFSVEEIQTIKNHVFYDKHIKYDGIGRFDPDYDMAVAWKRLVEGNPKERDILLLKHELLESKLEKDNNLTAAEAHKRANETYAWDDKLFEELGEAGEDDDLL